LGIHLIPLAANEHSAVIMTCFLRDAGRNMQTTVNRIELGRAQPTQASQLRQ
jgi:hypothetical protein